MRSDNNYKWLFALVVGVLIGIFIGKYITSAPSKDTKVMVTIKRDSVITKKDTMYVKTKPLNDHTLLAELKKNNIQHPNIVLAQAKLETGHYQSAVCKSKHNLFGLKCGKSYRNYRHWSESVKAYKKLIQTRYNGGSYFAFLDRIGYSENPNYVNELKNLI